MTKSIDEWTAEKCGAYPDLSESIVGSPDIFYLKGSLFRYLWTIEDPRCREIFRNWWLSSNNKRVVVFTKYGCLYLEPDDNPEDFKMNEIAAITGIYEAEK